MKISSTTGVILPVALALGGGIGAGIQHFFMPKWEAPGMIAIGAASSVSLVLFVVFLLKYIPVWLTRLKPRQSVTFTSFRNSQRFLPNQKVELPFTYIHQTVNGQDVLKEVTQSLRSSRVVIWEEGGSGKSTLAATALRHLHPQFSGGSLWISADERDLTSFFNELGIMLDCLREEDIRITLRRQLAALGPCLLVADNLDTASSDIILFLMRDLPPNCHLLSTTRHLDLTEHHDLGKPIQLRPTSEEARYFGEMLISLWARTHPTSLSLETLSNILPIANYNPKAIDLLLGQIEARGSAAPLEEVVSGEGIILDEIVGRSFKALTPDEQRVLCTLSVFAATAAPHDVAAISASNNAEELLGHLATWRLVDHDDTGARWWISEQVRPYVRARPITDEIRISFARHFLELAASATETGDTYSPNPTLNMHREDFFVAMEWCAQETKNPTAQAREAAELLIGFLRALHEFFYTLGYWDELLKYANLAVQAACPLTGNKACDADMYYILGLANENRSKHSEAARLYDKALALKYEVGDKKGAALVLFHLALLAEWGGRPSDANSIFERCLGLQREAGDIRETIFTLHRLGKLAYNKGDKSEAQQKLREALNLARNLGDKRGIAYNLDQLGAMAQAEGDMKTAESLYRESLGLKQVAMHERGILYTMDRLAALAYDRNDFEASLRLCREILKRKEKLGDNRGIAYTLHRIGMIAQARRKPKEAEKYYTRTLLFRKQRTPGDKKGIAETLVEIASLRDRQHKAEEAIILLREALSLLQDPHFQRNRERIEKYVASLSATGHGASRQSAALRFLNDLNALTARVTRWSRGKR